MLLKWLFTLLAILWLYQAVRTIFFPPQPPAPPPPAPGPDNRTVEKSRFDEDGEYIDYEEIK